MEFNHSQFIFAREYRGIGQTDLSKKIKGLSQSNLSKFEKGFDVLSENIIYELINFLNFPVTFFTKKINNDIEIAHYRKKSGITKAVKVQLDSNNKIIGYLVDQLNDSVDYPDFSLRPLDPEEYTPEEVARFTRKLIGLDKREPVINIFKYLESNGIIVIEFDDVTDKFDGVSFLTDKGNPVIVINRNFSNDRKRFTLAHELGHILMHCTGDFPNPMHRDEKQKENEANRFASEFLMPAFGIQNSLLGLSLYDLAPLKKYWHTSKQSIIRRAKDLRSIPENRATYFMIELSRMGERKVEKTLVYIDKPVIFKNAYELHKKELNYSDEDLSKAFYLPHDILKKYFNFSDKSKLRVII
ncbi:XRE family transcriptional regulator [Tenacibaculum finnmarkense]|uniref:ImmA/IrrE family metallo-endopeptidase n=2 Tax=Tenacibaculum finnmarkense TaxID=2781243 RepID=A0AAP1RH32_9FLAO|nr:XRE family transcriptional regulator [Tenacibaculum finnmarkense]MBE7633322.1 ImmA/IrrE family metallo-endopeptidase [Tenacibaculum finnmarkense genomovar ulcerans]MBE7644957.1 ImmA/IrrE family metallo-endopeptidase [Tenacibaculum finnmarkense genomovar ulcerans]MBE7653775.1 ImmA/IrrE family metallo-endopeptidase [Tenacibaculum finnmarkense genomovar finnmarkense]MBE7686889.1 ImmA/IrrE family metallo-endopeptidase [Tenacibaculum finnmarkense genomovar ulcerans]MBE7696090.1 ImmA/IrrE family 